MKATKTTPLTALLLTLGLVSTGSTVSALTLNEYLNQVKGDSTAYKASEAQADGAYLKSREADLIFTPKLFAEARTGHDGKPSSPPVMIYDRFESTNYQLGVSQQFNFGLQSKLYYQAAKSNFVGANFGAGVPTEYWDASPTVELSLPLLGGGFGRSARANEELTRQQNYAERFNNAAQSLNYIVGAEAAYWKLSAWQDVVKIQEQAMKAAQNIYDYVNRKRKMNLGETSDVIQAQALVESRTLELQVARNEAQEALRAFNKYRNQETYAPVDGLEPVDYKGIESLVVPATRPGDRLDLKATEAQLASAKASSNLVSERNQATLEVYGSYAMNGRDSKLNDAISNATKTADRDSAFVGMRFNMPLNLGATADARKGAMQAEKAAELNHQYSAYAQEQDWANLTRNLSDAKDNMKLLNRIEAVQKSKLENERTRLRQGRTTTYQVLLFEQDYSQAAVTRVKSAASILGLQSQIKLYQASSSEGGK